jgi:hypothetical protein
MHSGRIGGAQPAASSAVCLCLGDGPARPPTGAFTYGRRRMDTCMMDIGRHRERPQDDNRRI